jgi:Rps23 Pro-64 3,4-dihydroxylase Tpa1-like proline 4-hydroxylase
MSNPFTQKILQRLESDLKMLTEDYHAHRKNFGIGYVAIENLLPEADAQAISKAFDPQNSAWREMNSFREKKLTTKQFQNFDPILKEITFAFQEKEVVDLISRITGIQKQVPDSKLYAGGLSMMRESDFLDPHIDNSHDQSRKYYRRLNLLYYVTPEWRLENGGNLELWDKGVHSPVTIESKFNRLVLMETHKFSWHSVSPVTKQNSFRKCVSNYYFSEESPNGGVYYHVTSFMARPSQPLKRLFCRVDNAARMLVRKIKPGGIGQVDVYAGDKKS